QHARARGRGEGRGEGGAGEGRAAEAHRRAHGGRARRGLRHLGGREEGEEVEAVPPARSLFYVAPFGALALVARSLLVGPVPAWITLSMLVAYTAIVFAGVLFLRLRMFVDAVCHGPSDARGVALTFDDGPSPEHTPKVLDLLDRANVKATFFVIGKKA